MSTKTMRQVREAAQSASVPDRIDEIREGVRRLPDDPAVLKRIIEIERLALDKYGPCSDHNGKVRRGDECAWCRAQRAELRIAERGPLLADIDDRLRAVSARVGGEVTLTIYPVRGDFTASRWETVGRYQPDRFHRIETGSLDEVLAAVDALPARGEAA